MLSRIARVELLEIVFKFFVGGRDKRLQRIAREIAVLVSPPAPAWRLTLQPTHQHE
jgi:hypothetical protein